MIICIAAIVKSEIESGYIVVHILGLHFIFLLFLGMVMYHSEFETMENKIEIESGYIVVHIVGLHFIFLLFLGMVMYDNEFEIMENKIKTQDKIEPQQLHSINFVLHHCCCCFYVSFDCSLHFSDWSSSWNSRWS